VWGGGGRAGAPPPPGGGGPPGALPPPPPRDGSGAESRMKIAIFLPNWIGDAVMATPALRAVRSAFAEAEVVAVLRPYVADVLAGLDLADRLLVHDPRGEAKENRGWRFVRRLRGGWQALEAEG
jgi:hypothetical protein